MWFNPLFSEKTDFYAKKHEKMFCSMKWKADICISYSENNLFTLKTNTYWICEADLSRDTSALILFIGLNLQVPVAGPPSCLLRLLRFLRWEQPRGSSPFSCDPISWPVPVRQFVFPFRFFGHYHISISPQTLTAKIRCGKRLPCHSMPLWDHLYLSGTFGILLGRWAYEKALRPFFKAWKRPGKVGPDSVQQAECLHSLW